LNLFTHEELMTHSLLGRSGEKDEKTGIKVNYPEIDERRREAIMGIKIPFITSHI